MHDVDTVAFSGKLTLARDAPSTARIAPKLLRSSRASSIKIAPSIGMDVIGLLSPCC
jgi:hypothetical protein